MFWSYRRKILKNIKYDPTKEFCWSEAQIRAQPKIHFAWEHRRMIANANLNYCSAKTELDLAKSILELDPKSYHAWHHRQWSIQTHKFLNTGLMSSEMKFSADFILKDVRNNSAWNQRFYILRQRGRIDFEAVKVEVPFAVEKIKLALENEAAWNYLRGIVNEFGAAKGLPSYQSFVSFLETEFYEKGNQNRYLVAFLIDTKIESVLEEDSSCEIVQTQKVLQLCNLMAGKFDKFRSSYWNFVYKQFYYDKIKQRLANKSIDSGGSERDETWKINVGKKMVDDPLL